jgi:hypothetical protein
MSLKFLAVGRSIAGIRSDKSPYELRKENQLPTFVSAPRFKHVAKPMVQTDWLESPRAAMPAPEVAMQQPIERQMPMLAPAPVQAIAPKRRWFRFFGLKWFQTTKPRVDLVQSELTLEKVQPLRNDLADSDLRLVLKRKKKSSTEQEPSPMRAGWSELTARLFELGQK